MDCIKIVSTALTDLIGKIVTKAVRSKIGVDCDIKVVSVEAQNKDGKMHLNLAIAGDIETKDIPKLLKNLKVL